MEVQRLRTNARSVRQPPPTHRAGGRRPTPPATTHVRGLPATNGSVRGGGPDAGHKSYIARCTPLGPSSPNGTGRCRHTRRARDGAAVAVEVVAPPALIRRHTPSIHRHLELKRSASNRGGIEELQHILDSGNRERSTQVGEPNPAPERSQAAAQHNPTNLQVVKAVTIVIDERLKDDAQLAHILGGVVHEHAVWD